MKHKGIYLASLMILLIAVASMGCNWFLSPLPDTAVRIIGGVMLIDVVILSYSTAKLRMNGKKAKR